MPSGTIYGSTGSRYIDSKIEWSYTQDISANTSTITAALYYKRNNTGNITQGSGTYTITIDGETKSASNQLIIKDGEWEIAVDLTKTVPHNPDGTKSVAISASGSQTSSALSVTYCSGTVTLNTIPRASSISSALDRALGEACSVSWAPLSPTFTYKLNFSVGNWSHTTGVIKPITTASYTYTGYTLPLDVANQVKTKTGTMQVILATYSDINGTVQVGSNASKNITITVPENDSTKPTVSMSLAPSNSLKSPYNSMYLQGHSKVKATLTPSTKYEATVEASNITVNGVTYSSPYESATIAQSGKVSVKATVRDSRGYDGTNHQDIEVIPYSKPYVQAFSGESSIIAARCDSSANFTNSGTYLKIKAKAVFSKVITNGTQNNYGNLKYRYRVEGGTYSGWTTILNGRVNNSDEIETAPLLNGALDIESNYQVEIVAFDDLYESAPITIAVPSDAVYMDRPAGGKSMGLGGYSTGDGNLDVYWKTKARGGLSLFDSKGDEISLDSTLPIPRGQVAEGWNPNTLENGAYVVTSSKALKDSNGNVIMHNGVLIQINGTVDGSVKMQLALTSDENKNPFYRAYWNGNWGNWRSFKL